MIPGIKARQLEPVQPGDPESRAKLMRQAHAIARDLTLTDEERRELAMMLPSRKGAQGPVSWGSLDADELAHLVQWLHGTRLMLDLYRLR